MNMFSSVKMTQPRKSKFNLSYERKMSINMGKLYPTMVQEVVPGDSFRVTSEILARFSPMLAPIMHRVNVWTHYFFVPNRLIWDEWEDFITGGADGEDLPVAPFIYPSRSTDAADNWIIGGLPDYLGVPVDMITDPTTDMQQFNALPFRAYYKIWYEYFRDQNLAATASEPQTTSGLVDISEAGALNRIKTRCWEKDYFTSALPWLQRGPEALLPMSIEPDYMFPAVAKLVSDAAPAAGTMTTTASTGVIQRGADIKIENLNTLENSSISINDLRSSMRLQEWLEKNARGGSRYIEQILSHFGVRSKDSRLQRPEYLGGGMSPAVISEVLNTVGTPGDLPQGYMAGHGVSMGNMNGFKRSFTEHGFVIGLISVLPKTAYQQGLPYYLQNRNDKFDYYWPEFAHLGEQPILDNEVYYDDTDQNSTDIFGYTPRYAPYKYNPSTVHGEFRNSLDYWHMGRIFDARPALDNAFVQSDPTKRIFAVTDDDTEDIYLQIFHKFDALRPMPYYGTPRL